jgi:hypothetical protein
MLNPVVLPVPAALAILAVLAAALIRAVNRQPWPPLTARSAAAPAQAAATGRHRLENAADPYRPSPAPAPAEILAARIEETRTRAGNGMWSWSDANWAGDTRELAAAR